MLHRVLEPEVMDSPEEARDYDAMDHSQVNRSFALEFLQKYPGNGPVLDVGTGTAQIPIEICRLNPRITIVGIDLASQMLLVGNRNVLNAGLAERVRLEQIDAKRLPYETGFFEAVLSNSIVHHIPEPTAVLREMVRTTTVEGILFVRDLLRPSNNAEVFRLVGLYAGGANDHQRKMFEDSLRAALSLSEIRDMVMSLGFPAATVQQTSDRHWTWSASKPAAG